MTKYYDEHIRRQQPLPNPNSGKIIIDADDYGDDPVREWRCPWCNHILHARKSRKEIDCPNCTATLDLGAGKAQETKKIVDPNKSRAVDTTPFVTSVQYNFDDMVSHVGQRPEPKGGFKALQQKGLRITNYR